MKGKLVAIVAALVLTQVLSGCYVLREINWTKDKVTKGKFTAANVSLFPSGPTSARFGVERGGPGNDSYFILALVGENQGIDVKRPTFDKKNQTGQRERMVKDNALRDQFLNECQFFGGPLRARGGADSAFVYRTKNVVSSETRKFIRAKQPVKAVQKGGGFIGLAMTGYWDDDGDGVPEADQDEINCTGLSTTAFLVKGQRPN